jgi:hypothetical protein
MVELSQRILQDLVDRQEILDCVLRYARGVDRRDYDLVLSAFHEDAIEKHGPFYGHPREFVDWIREFTAGRDSSHHMIGNHLVEIDGDVAHAETYFRSGRLKGNVACLSEGRFISRFERRDGVWRIARRETIVDWRANFPALPQESEFSSAGRFDRSDISYLRPFEPSPSEHSSATPTLSAWDPTRS